MEKSLSILLLVLICCEITSQKECGSLIITDYEELDELENCTAILGNLVLNFPIFDDEETNYNASMINNRTFPLLYEITGYFGVFLVTHLDSLGNMFPELRVIRGRRLFSNFAFFIYDSGIREVN
jgi:hypothetical protein